MESNRDLLVLARETVIAFDKYKQAKMLAANGYPGGGFEFVSLESCINDLTRAVRKAGK